MRIAVEELYKHVAGVDQWGYLSGCKCGWKRDIILSCGDAWIDFIDHIPKCDGCGQLDLTTDDKDLLHDMDEACKGVWPLGELEKRYGWEVSHGTTDSGSAQAHSE